MSPEDRFNYTEVSPEDRFHCIEVSPNDRFHIGCTKLNALGPPVRGAGDDGDADEE